MMVEQRLRGDTGYSKEKIRIEKLLLEAIIVI